MESLIATVNKLQDICHVLAMPLPLDLPQIAVVGTQSSGKSSVIEAIVQREFLPRGSGIVTRRPLVIRLFKIRENDSVDPQSAHGDWVKFTHSDKILTDFDEVRQEIERETERVCGSNKGISAEPITLGVYSKNVVNLTLVDLPGLTKNPVGSQPEDIEIQIRELVMKYIKNPNSIVLAVTAANTDIATSEAIKLARDVDPNGDRTLAVLTKLDIMDSGTDASEVLTGKLLPIKLGIIGVVNRSQKDIVEKKSIQKAIEDEANFLQRRYPMIAHQNGQPYLSKRLSHLLIKHIRNCLPDLKAKANSLISEYQARLIAYGDPVTDKTKMIIDIITKFSLSYCETITGGKRQVRTKELVGGARIKYLFHEQFAPVLSKINPLETLDNRAILTATRNVAGLRSSITIPDVFESLVSSQIERLKDPCLQCVDQVHKEMIRNFKHCGDEVHLDLIRFPNLREKIEEILTRLIEERLPVARDAVVELVEYGTALIDAEDPRLRESCNALYCEPNKSPAGPVVACIVDDASPRHERELKECEIIARKIKAYFNIVRDEMKIFVPRAIMRSMVNHVRANLQSALIKGIYCSNEDMFDHLLSESDNIAMRRSETKEMLSALKQAREIINEIDNK